MNTEQFEQAKKWFEEKYGIYPDWEKADKFSSDLNSLLEQHKEVMCKQCKEQHKAVAFPGRPDPRDVNPYDIRSVHRARNPRKRT